MAIVLKARDAVVEHDGDFESFYSAGFEVVYRAAYAFSQSTEVAGEATQEAFVRAFARWRRLRRHHWAMGWVMTTAMNVCRKLLKEGARNRFAPQPRDDYSSHDRIIQHVDVVTLLGTLPPRQRQAVVLHYIGGYQVAEVADLMGLSAGGVKSHLFKARRALRIEADDADQRPRERRE